MLWFVLKLHLLFLLRSFVPLLVNLCIYVSVYIYTHAYRCMCSEPEGCTEGSVRLSGGNLEQEGIPEVCVNGVWGSICSRDWHLTNGQVICRELGYHDNGTTLFVLEQTMVNCIS